MLTEFMQLQEVFSHCLTFHRVKSYVSVENELLIRIESISVAMIEWLYKFQTEHCVDGCICVIIVFIVKSRY